MTTDFRKPELRGRPPQDKDDPTMGSEDGDVAHRFRARDIVSERYKNENREQRRADVKEGDGGILKAKDGEPKTKNSRQTEGEGRDDEGDD